MEVTVNCCNVMTYYFGKRSKVGILLKLRSVLLGMDGEDQLVRSPEK
jgi:hypothetical protein